jgi:2-oxoglutarate dehydrogenase complex dehydrogenase (E1) component-like enzyme
MGAWRFMRERFLDGDVGGELSLKLLRYVGREPSAAPAPGSHKLHVREQDAILAAAFGA